jgi:hypothetical protein
MLPLKILRRLFRKANKTHPLGERKDVPISEDIKVLK